MTNPDAQDSEHGSTPCHPKAAKKVATEFIDDGFQRHLEIGGESLGAIPLDKARRAIESRELSVNHCGHGLGPFGAGHHGGDKSLKVCVALRRFENKSSQLFGA